VVISVTSTKMTNPTPTNMTDEWDLDYDNNKVNKVARRNKYYSQRRGSIAAAPTDDDDVRSEISRLTFAEEQLRHELLQAVVSSGETDLVSSLTNGEHQRQQQDQMSVDNDDSGELPIEVEEEQEVQKPKKSNKKQRKKPWYFGVLRRRKKPQSLEDEIRQQKEMLRKSLKTMDEGLEDVMDCQTETQEQLIKQSLEEIHDRRQSKSFDDDMLDAIENGGNAIAKDETNDP